MSDRKSMRGEELWLPPDLYNPVYVCLWQLTDGSFIQNSDGEYLCAESFTKNDPDVEKKMRAAAISFGYAAGHPSLRLGRKVTEMEYDDQMERMLEGKIPDEKEEALIAIEEELLKKNGLSEGD